MVSPKVWGSSGWYVIHKLGCNFDNTKVQLYRAILDTFRHLLPCKKCRINYTRHLTRHPLTQIVDKESYIAWTIKLHHIVNGSRPSPELDRKYRNRYYANNSIDHKIFAKFIRYIFQDVVKKPSANRFQASNRFQSVLKRIHPCLKCRENLSKIKTKGLLDFTKSYH